MQDFIDKYREIHNKINEDKGLVAKLFETVSANKFHQEYLSTGLEINGIPIGLDSNITHVLKYKVILARMRLLYECTDGTADLLKVYALLQVEKGNKKYDMGIVSEDLTDNEKNTVLGWSDETAEVVKKLFYSKDHELDLGRIQFQVFDNSTGKLIREPFVDLDHVEVINNKDATYLRYSDGYFDNVKNKAVFTIPQP
jgi:hypothetical protein